MAEKFIYFDIQYAVNRHDWIIENSGGLHGAFNLGLLESVLQNIQNDDYYSQGYFILIEGLIV